MNKTVLIVAGVVLALFLAVPLLAKVKTASEGGTSVEQSSASGEAGSSAPAANLPPTWNSGNLPGTAWNVNGYVVNVQAGGVATASTPFGNVQGTWSINGSTLTVSAMGKTINATISGDQILVDGKPAQRVQ